MILVLSGFHFQNRDRRIRVSENCQSPCPCSRFRMPMSELMSESDVQTLSESMSMTVSEVLKNLAPEIRTPNPSLKLKVSKQLVFKSDIRYFTRFPDLKSWYSHALRRWRAYRRRAIMIKSCNFESRDFCLILSVLSSISRVLFKFCCISVFCKSIILDAFRLKSFRW